MTSSRKTSTRSHGKSRQHNARAAEATTEQPASPSRAWKALYVIAAAAVAVVVVFYTFHPVMDPDTWFHLRLGRWILQKNALPHIDPFSYTAGRTPYVPSGWLTALIMVFADMLYPESSLGPILMVTLAVGLAAGLVLVRGWRARTLPLTALLLLAGIMLAATRFSPRPDVWSFAGLGALLFILSHNWVLVHRDESFNESADRQRQECPSYIRLWLLVPLMALWANLHAGVLIALPFLMSYAVWLGIRFFRTRRPIWLAALAPVIAACFAWLANPYGWGLIGLAQRIAQMPDVTWVMEWMPLYWTRFPLPWPTRVGFFIVAGIAVAVISRRWRAFHPLELLWIAGLVFLAIMQRRQVGLMGFGVPLLLSRHLVRRPDRRTETAGGFWKGAALIAGALALCGMQYNGANGTGSGWPMYGRNCAKLPCYTADFLKIHTPPQPIFNSYNLGGYLLNILWPETKVYIDGRLDTYPPQVWEDMLALEENRLSINDFVARYGVKTFVLTIKESFGDPMHLASRLAARPDYVLVHLDDVAAVFVHRDSVTAKYVEALGYPHLEPWDLDRMANLTKDPATQQDVVTETGRLLQQMPVSAAVHSLAGFVALTAGDRQVARQQLATAEQLQPENKLLQLVKGWLSRDL